MEATIDRTDCVTSDKVTLIIPVRRAGESLKRCLSSVMAGTVVPQIFLMDCTADADALRGIRSSFPGVRIFDFGMNPGRAHAVNTGIHITRTPYVMTLSPDIVAGKHFTEKLCRALDRDGSLLSVQGKILREEDPSRLVSAGWSMDLCAEPYVRGAGAKASGYSRRARISAAGLDAAIFRLEYLEVTGLFDERFYCRLEDLDLGFRAGLAGFGNLYEPDAVCKKYKREMTPEVSEFYRQLEVGNLEYFRYKYGLRSLKLPIGEAPSEDEAAIERGKMLAFRSEIEMMERQELGMSVTKQTLPEEFCMEIQKDGPADVYPLYVGERAQIGLSDLPGLLRICSGMAAGTAGRLYKMLSFLEKI